jgi:flagella basal body P-ring formation protein FlgA
LTVPEKAGGKARGRKLTMRRKDCGLSDFEHEHTARRCPVFRAALCIATAVVLAGATEVLAGSIRLTAEAVVVADDIRLDALCDLSGFDYPTERALAEVVVASAPQEGGSRHIHLDMVRSAVEASGFNMARVTIGGALACAVTRPGRPVAPSVVAEEAFGGRASETLPSTTAPASQAEEVEEPKTTLREAVIDFLNQELVRYGGKADIIFGQTDPQILDLTGPPFEFVVERRPGPPLGTVHLEVSVLAEGNVVQRVPLTVNARMTRRVVVARGPINQEAVIRESDVTRAVLTFTRVDKIGVADPSAVVGQRAKRFIPAGSRIEPDHLEQVPLVVRGQLVTLVSSVGGIEVLTAAKAMAKGYLGDTIAVRDTNNRRRTFDAVIVGPGKLRVGPGKDKLESVQFASGR